MKNEKTKNYEDGGLFTIYGGRISKSGLRINISLIQEDDKGNKKFSTISIPKDKVINSKKEKNVVYVRVKMLSKDNKAKVDAVEDEDTTF